MICTCFARRGRCPPKNVSGGVWHPAAEPAIFAPWDVGPDADLDADQLCLADGGLDGGLSGDACGRGDFIRIDGDIVHAH